jgi:hypothetical protein
MYWQRVIWRGECTNSWVLYIKYASTLDNVQYNYNDQKKSSAILLMDSIVTYKWLAWRIIVGSVLDESIYRSLTRRNYK